MPSNAPPPWLVFAVMFAAVSLFVGFLYLVSALSRGARRLSEPETRAHIRSRIVQGSVQAMHRVRERSARANAENGELSTVQPFNERSTTNASAGDLPATVDELQRLAYTITLYTKRPNKEIAIFEAWGETKGEGEGYQRASKLFDLAMSEAARRTAKAKPQPPVREVETA